jgi:hypothetical protein
MSRDDGTSLEALPGPTHGTVTFHMKAINLAGDLVPVNWTGPQIEALGFAAGILKACQMREMHLIAPDDRWSAGG